MTIRCNEKTMQYIGNFVSNRERICNRPPPYDQMKTVIDREASSLFDRKGFAAGNDADLIALPANF